MSLPPVIQTVTVSFGPFIDFQGQPLRGSTTFEPSTPVLAEATGTPILNRTIVVEWDADGMGAVILPATDSVGLDRTGFTYRVTHRTYDSGVPAPTGGNIMLPAAAPNVDLDLLVPVTASNGIVVEQPAVTSVAGLTGAPTAQQVVDALAVPLGAALVPRPTGGTDGQALVKSGTDVAWGDVAGGTSLLPRLTVPAQKRTMITAFQSGHGWTGNGTGTINLNDTSDAGLGTQHVSVLTSGGGNVGGQRSEVTKTGIPTFDMTTKAIAVLARVDTLANLDQVRIGVGTDPSNYFLVSAIFGPAVAQNNAFSLGEWQWFTIDLSAAPATIGAPTKTACTWMMLRVTDTGGGNKATVHFGAVALIDKPVANAPNGVVTFGFDDGYVDQFTKARPILDRYGYGATCYVIQDQIGAAPGVTYMGLNQLHQLEDVSGWEVAAHSRTTADHNVAGGLTSLTETQLRANLEQHKQWLIDNHFRGVDHFAYPQGLWNAETLRITRDYFATARLVAPGFEAIPPFEPLRMKTQPINAGTALSALTGLVDKAKSERSWLVFYTHRVLDAGAVGTQIDTTTFTSLVDYVAAAGVEVRTMTGAMRLAPA